ncbi:MAG: outer membrane beta-barrel protein, partial [Flavitalea sp.]
KPSLNITQHYELVNSENSTVVKKIANKKISKWSFGISTFVGTSFLNNGDLLNFDQSKVEDVSSSRGLTAPAPAPGVTPLFSPRGHTPSVVSPGFSFSAGAVAKRKLSKRFSVSAGLTYSQFNTLSRVGQKINAAQVVNTGTGYLSVQNYYLIDETETSVYKNRYHFIELPVSVFYRINNRGKLPIYINGGLVVSQLLQSTSLHFDGTTGVYYKNDRLINQTQAGVSAGISFALFSKKERPLWVGPTVRSNISSILEKEVSENKHFLTLGLDLKYFIK